MKKSEKNIKTHFALPLNPEEVYRDKWNGWDDFLGNKKVWSQKDALDFLKSIKKEMQFLESVELITIIQQSGAIDILKKDKNYEELLRSSPKTHLRKKAIGALIDGIRKETINSETESEESFLETELTVKGGEMDERLDEIINNTRETTVCSVDSYKKKYPEELKAFDSFTITSSMDEESINYLMKFRHEKLWRDFMSEELDVEILRKETGGKYFNKIKQTFLDEYDAVSSIQLPDGYSFSDNNSNLIQPNLMQKLTAYRLMKRKRYGNWSGPGAGKTLAAILAGRFVNAKKTLIISFNSTIDNWKDSINASFPDKNKIFSKENKNCKFVDGFYNYLVLNYETFQQEGTPEFINSFLSKNEIDYVILDEVHSVKQRDETTSSYRRHIIKKLIARITNKNSNAYVMVMSATPVINNLVEPKKIIELLNGVEYDDIKTYPNINNAIQMHRHLFLNGIRFKPKYPMSIETKFVKVDALHLIQAMELVNRSHVLKMERTLLKAKLKAIVPHLRKGVIIYSYYVSGIVSVTKMFCESLGFKVGLYTGLDKSGLDKFKSGEIDILIGSSPMGTGMDGLQKISDKMIILTLPWTSSEYENLKGRLYRQGSNFDSAEIIIPQIVLELKNNEEENSNTNDDNVGNGIVKEMPWDLHRFYVLEYKKTLSSTVLDGVIPDSLIPNRSAILEQAQDSIKKWMEKIKENKIVHIEREKIIFFHNDETVEVKQEFPEITAREIVPVNIENTEYEPTEDEIIQSNKENKVVIGTMSSADYLKKREGLIISGEKHVPHKRRNIIEETKMPPNIKHNIAVKINNNLTIYVDDPSKIEIVKKKYGGL